jgi:hypothetical protein
MLVLESGTKVQSLHRARTAAVVPKHVNINKQSTTPGEIQSRSVPCSPSSNRLRANLLHKLGIDKGAVPTKEQPRLPSRGSLLGNVPIGRVPLKAANAPEAAQENHHSKKQQQPCKGGCRVGRQTPADTLVHAMSALWTRQQLPAATRQSRDDDGESITSADSLDSFKHVRFQSEVTVVPIPRRSEYSKRIRKFLWENPVEMQASILRNTLEFTADGWQWEAALEEDEHFVDPSTGELIHPIHVEIAQMDPQDRENLLPKEYLNPVNNPSVFLQTTTLPHPAFL